MPFTAWIDEVRRVDTSRHALKSFAMLVGVVLVAIGVFVHWRTAASLFDPAKVHLAAATLVGVGAFLIVLGYFAAPVLRPVYLVWMGLAIVLGAVMTRVILSVVFIALVVPIGLVMKLFGRDPLLRRFDPESSSYWVSRSDMDRSPDRLEKYY